MSTLHKHIKLYETVLEPCPYLQERQSVSVLVDPEHRVDGDLFALLSGSGFRRSGEMLYTPKCPACNACVSVRIPVLKFQKSRNQKRVWKKNQDLDVKIEKVHFDPAHFAMYLRYQQHRHPDSSMCDEDPSKYLSFINSSYSQSVFFSFYKDEELIGICVVDRFKNGLSAVYTFFEPEHSKRSLGTYAILYMLHLAKQKNTPYVYLGYWIDGSDKMDYKRNFSPLQGYIDRNWVEMQLRK